MSAPMKLSEVRRLELREKVEALLSNGDVSLLPVAEHDVLVELARRYVVGEIARRNRKSSRAREQFAKVREGANEKLRAKVRVMVDQLAADLRTEWDAALLLSFFSLPDGTRVQWLTATVPQHEARVKQLESLAAGDLHTASIHRRAVSDIQAAHAIDLSGVTS